MAARPLFEPRALESLGHSDIPFFKEHKALRFLFPNFASGLSAEDPQDLGGDFLDA